MITFDHDLRDGKSFKVVVRSTDKPIDYDLIKARGGPTLDCPSCKKEFPINRAYKKTIGVIDDFSADTAIGILSVICIHCEYKIKTAEDWKEKV